MTDLICALFFLRKKIINLDGRKKKKSLFSMRKAYCLNFSSLAASSITSYL